MSDKESDKERKSIVEVHCPNCGEKHEYDLATAPRPAIASAFTTFQNRGDRSRRSRINGRSKREFKPTISTRMPIDLDGVPCDLFVSYQRNKAKKNLLVEILDRQGTDEGTLDPYLLRNYSYLVGGGGRFTTLGKAEDKALLDIYGQNTEPELPREAIEMILELYAKPPRTFSQNMVRGIAKETINGYECKLKWRYNPERERNNFRSVLEYPKNECSPGQLEPYAYLAECPRQRTIREPIATWLETESEAGNENNFKELAKMIMKDRRETSTSY